MANQTFVWKAICEVLGDGLWHEYHDVIYRVSKKIPPNVAIRWGELQRKRTWESRHPGAPLPPRTKHHSLEEQALYGARFMIRRSLHNNATIEYGKYKGKEYVRQHRAGVKLPPSNIPGIVSMGAKIGNRKRTAGKTPYSQLPLEEQNRLRKQRIEKARRTRLIRRGLNPDTHVPVHELRKKEALERATQSDDEQFIRRSAASRKGWETKRKQASNE